MSPSKQEGDSWGRFCGRDPWRSLTLLHFYFWWSQEGPVFLLFLSFRIGLEVSPAVHATISTFLNTKGVWVRKPVGERKGYTCSAIPLVC